MAADPHPFTAFAGRYSTAWIDHLAETEDPGTDSCALHDPLAVAAVTRPDLLQVAEVHLDVQLDGVARGVMVADRQPRPEDVNAGSPSTWTRPASPTTSPAVCAAVMAADARGDSGPPLRLAIVGTGSRGMTYGREAVRTGTAVVTAVAEPRPDRRAAAAAEFGVADGWSVAELAGPRRAGRPRRRCGGGGHARPPAHRPGAGVPGPRAAAAAGEADGAERGRGPPDRGRRRARRTWWSASPTCCATRPTPRRSWPRWPPGRSATWWPSSTWSRSAGGTTRTPTSAATGGGRTSPTRC